MNIIQSKIRRPVKRQGSENYLLITLFSFAASVTMTRLFLEITGYPQLGGGNLHIAHVLWGGLFLFVASMLPLILANRWVYIVGAITSGVGVGLFIDEVGKFITQNNDYFYPAAAPIIYVFFLITVLVYIQIRRKKPSDARSEFYSIFEAFEEVLDHDLNLEERQSLISRLRNLAQLADQPMYSGLSKELLEYLENDVPFTPPSRPGISQKVNRWMRSLEEKVFTQNRMRAILAGGLTALGINTLTGFFRLLLFSYMPELLQNTINRLFSAGILSTSASLNWFIARILIEGSTGILLVVSAIFIMLNKDSRGITLSFYTIVASLTGVTLIVFNYEQFSTILLASIQFIMLMGILYYRNRYVKPALQREES
jgi:hypothetical protein